MNQLTTQVASLSQQAARPDPKPAIDNLTNQITQLTTQVTSLSQQAARPDPKPAIDNLTNQITQLTTQVRQLSQQVATPPTPAPGASAAVITALTNDVTRLTVQVTQLSSQVIPQAMIRIDQSINQIAQLQDQRNRFAAANNIYSQCMQQAVMGHPPQPQWVGAGAPVLQLLSSVALTPLMIQQALEFEVRTISNCVQAYINNFK